MMTIEDRELFVNSKGWIAKKGKINNSVTKINKIYQTFNCYPTKKKLHEAYGKLHAVLSFPKTESRQRVSQTCHIELFE